MLESLGSAVNPPAWLRGKDRPQTHFAKFQALKTSLMTSLVLLYDRVIGQYCEYILRVTTLLPVTSKVKTQLISRAFLKLPET